MWPFKRKCRHDFGNYGSLEFWAEDGIGRVHARVIMQCYHCKEQKEVTKVHLPKWVQDYQFRRDRDDYGKFQNK